jgi:hypothetical protein
MLELGFAETGVQAERYAASPGLLFALKVTERTGVRVHTLALRCQLRIEPQRRHYSATEEAGLRDLFGEPVRWGNTLRPLQFAQASALLPGFTGAADVALSVPCSYDTDVAATKYFRALDGGEIPLLLLFSGTVFYAAGSGLQIEAVPWDRELSVRLPVAVWREAIDLHFPRAGWLRLHDDTVTALERYRSTRMLPDWDSTLLTLLTDARERA